MFDILKTFISYQFTSINVVNCNNVCKDDDVAYVVMLGHLSVIYYMGGAYIYTWDITKYDDF